MNYTEKEVSILERIATAKDSATTKKVLTKLADDPETKVRLFVAANPNTPKTVLTKLAEQFPRYVATNPNTPVNILKKLDPAYVVSNRNAPESLFNQLANHSSVIVRYYLAANPHTSESVLRELAANENESFMVLENIAWHPNAPEDLLSEIEDLLPEIREVGEKWNIISELDPYLSASEVEEIGNDYQIASHINTSLTTLERFANHEDWLVRYLVIQNPNTPESLAASIESEIAKTESFPKDSRKCLVLDMLGKMNFLTNVRFWVERGLPIIVTGDEIVDFRWSHTCHNPISEIQFFGLYNHYSLSIRIIGFLQKGISDESDGLLRCLTFNLSYKLNLEFGEADKDQYKSELAAELSVTFYKAFKDSFLPRHGLTFQPFFNHDYSTDFREILEKYDQDNKSSDWKICRPYGDDWLSDYLDDLLGLWSEKGMNAVLDCTSSSYYNQLLEALHRFPATYEEHFYEIIDFWEFSIIGRNVPADYKIFNQHDFSLNPYYNILEMLKKIENSENITKEELRTTIDILLEAAPIAADEDQVIEVLAKHQNLVIEVSGLKIVDDADDDEVSGLKIVDDADCTDYESFVKKQDWETLFYKSEGERNLAHIAYLLIKIILYNRELQKTDL